MKTTTSTRTRSPHLLTLHTARKLSRARSLYVCETINPTYMYQVISTGIIKHILRFDRCSGASLGFIIPSPAPSKIVSSKPVSDPLRCFPQFIFFGSFMFALLFALARLLTCLSATSLLTLLRSLILSCCFDLYFSPSHARSPISLVYTLCLHNSEISVP